LMTFKDWIDHAIFENNKPLMNEKIKVIFSDGTEKEVTTDSNGRIQLKDAPPGKITLDLINDDDLKKDEENIRQQLEDRKKAEGKSSPQIKGKDESCDAGQFGPAPSISTKNSSSSEGTSSLDNTYDQEFLHEEQERSVE